MYRLVFLVVCSFGVTTKACEIQSSNMLWERNDKLLITLDLIYDNLAKTIRNDACNPHKRSFSIISRLILIYVRKYDATIPKVLKHANKIMEEPADVIADDVRKTLDVLRAIIDEPINDIKKRCRPNRTTFECEEHLQHHTSQRRLKCPFYLNHVKLREDMENLLLENDFQRLLEGAIETSVNGTDSVAVDFFINNVMDGDRRLLKKMFTLWKRYKHEVFPCMYKRLYRNWQIALCPSFNYYNDYSFV